jgi:hypothetical protein
MVPPSGGRFIGVKDARYRILVEPFGSYWIVREPFSYVTRAGWRIDVPVDFVTDFASTPSILWPFLPPTDPRYRGAAIAHDVCYERHEGIAEDGETRIAISRLAADRLLVEAACVEGCSPFWRGAIYRAVRLFGGMAYATGPARQKQRRAELGLT